MVNSRRNWDAPSIPSPPNSSAKNLVCVQDSFLGPNGTGAFAPLASAPESLATTSSRTQNPNGFDHPRYVTIGRWNHPQKVVHWWKSAPNLGVKAPKVASPQNNDMGISENRGTPVIIHVHRIFHEINHAAIGVPPTGHGNPHILLINFRRMQDFAKTALAACEVTCSVTGIVTEEWL